MTWTVHNCDALEFLQALPAGSVDAVITDPPYSSGGQFRGDRAQSTRAKYQQSDVQTAHETFPGDNRDQRSWLLWCSLWMGECLRAAKPGALICVFTDWRQLPQTTDAIQCAGWVYRGIVPWNKVIARPVADRFRAQCEYLVWGTNGARDQDPAPDSVYLPGFFEVRTVPTEEREHATQKPLELMRQIVRLTPGGGGRARSVLRLRHHGGRGSSRGTRLRRLRSLQPLVPSLSRSDRQGGRDAVDSGGRGRGVSAGSL